MKQIVPFLLLLALAATMLYSCQDVVMPETPPQTPDFELVEVNLPEGDEVTAGESFVVTVKLQETNENIAVEGVEVNLNGGSFVDHNNEPKTIGSAETNSGGIATFNNLRITDADTYELRITSGNSEVSNEVLPKLTVKPAEADPDNSQFVNLPEEIEVGGDPLNIEVEVSDKFNNVRAYESDVVKIRISKTNGTQNLPDIERKDFINGLHVFELMFKDGEEGVYELNLEVNEKNKTGKPKSLTVVQALDTPSKIEIIQEPIETTAGEVIQGEATDTFPTVRIENRKDQPISGVNVQVTLERGQFKEGTTTITTNNEGVATFDDLKIKEAGERYKLIFQVEGQDNLREESNEFRITPSDPDEIIISDQFEENAEFEANSKIGEVKVRVEDEFKNPVPGVSVNVVLLDGSGNEVENGFTDESVTDLDTGDNGEAIFDDLIIEEPGTYKLRFEVEIEDGADLSVESKEFIVNEATTNGGG